MILDYKSHFGEIKDLDMKNRRISGYLSSFDNKDSDGDIIVKGAYKRTLDNRKDQIFFLNQHDWKQPHGKFDELKEDNKGLFFVSNPLIDTSYSMDTLKLYEAGIIKEHSVGFITVKDEVKSDARYIKEIKLYEGSNVTLGANSETPFTGFKSMDKKEVDSELKLFLKAFRDGSFTDDTFGLLEIAIKQLMKQSAILAVDNYKNHSDPLESTQDSMIETNIIKQFISERWKEKN